MTALQGSFVDGFGDVDLTRLDDLLTRTVIGDGAWIDLRRGWVTGSEALFAQLEIAVPWRGEERWMYDRVVGVPRLLAYYGEGLELPDPILGRARAELTAHYRAERGGQFATAGLCLYRDGRDSVAWHGDRIGRGATEDVLVAIISLGAPRRFLLRPREGGPALRFEIGQGDLLVMGGNCQRTWDHSVPKSTRPVGPRISVQFRPRDSR